MVRRIERMVRMRSRRMVEIKGGRESYIEDGGR